jgi:hypothetical protein
VGSPGHAAARDYLLGRLQQLDLAPYRPDSLDLPYRAGRREFHNLAGVVPGTDRARRPLLIGAHYDSVDTACFADDNAAAVAIALSAAEVLSTARLSRDVVIALFDAEEPPHFLSPSMGSTRFYEDQRLPAGFDGALIMDLVGHDVSLGNLPLPGVRAADLLFVTGAESHPTLATVLRSVSGQGTMPIVATLNRYVGDMSDHHVFRVHEVPYLFLTCGQWEHYHQVTDTPDRLNYAKMGRICEVLVDLVRRLDAESLTPRGTSASGGNEHDTTALEIELFNNVFGAALPGVLSGLGLRRLQTRSDLDNLVEALQGTFRL